MNNTLKLFKNIILPLFVLFLLMFMFIFTHERTHGTIYEYHDCKPYYTLMTTSTDEECNITKELRHSQDMVDVIGYQLFPIYMLLVLFMVFYLFPGKKE